MTDHEDENEEDIEYIYVDEDGNEVTDLNEYELVVEDEYLNDDQKDEFEIVNPADFAQNRDPIADEPSPKPWVSFLIRPRDTLDHLIYHGEADRFAMRFGQMMVLTIPLVYLTLLSGTDTPDTRDSMGVPSSGIGLFALTAILRLVEIYVVSTALFLTGNAFGGNADYRELRAGVLWTMIAYLYFQTAFTAVGFVRVSTEEVAEIRSFLNLLSIGSLIYITWIYASVTSYCHDISMFTSTVIVLILGAALYGISVYIGIFVGFGGIPI